MILWLLAASAPHADAAPTLDDVAKAALSVKDDPFDPESREGFFNSTRRDCSNFVNDTLDRAGFGYTNLNSKGRWEVAQAEGRAVRVKQGSKATPCPDPGQIAYWIDTTYAGQGISHVGIVAAVDTSDRRCRVTVVDHRGVSHGRAGVRSFPMDLANPDEVSVDGESVNHILRYSDRTLAAQLLYGFSTPTPLDGAQPALIADASEPDPTPPLTETEGTDTATNPKASRRARGRLAESLKAGHAGAFHEQPRGMRTLDATELRILRNLLFAKNHLPFSDDVLRCVYGQQEWYEPVAQQTPDLALQGFDRLDNALMNRILREERSRKKSKPASNRLAALVDCEEAQDVVEDAIKGKAKVLCERFSPQVVASLKPSERDVVMRHLVDRIERNASKPQKTVVVMANLFDLVRHVPGPVPSGVDD